MSGRVFFPLAIQRGRGYDGEGKGEKWETGSLTAPDGRTLDHEVTPWIPS
ncbi:hypothetical protein PLACP1_32080 [Planifilum fimeticola]